MHNPEREYQVLAARLSARPTWWRGAWMLIVAALL